MTSQMRLLFFVVLLSLPSPASGQPAALTLEDAIAQGLANSRRLAELEARGQAADFAIAGRQAAERPLVALLGGYTRTNHVEAFAISAPGRAPQVVYPDIRNYPRAPRSAVPFHRGRGYALEPPRAERCAIASDVEQPGGSPSRDHPLYWRSSPPATPIPCSAVARVANAQLPT